VNEDSGIDSLIALEVKITIHWVNLCPAVEHGKITRVILVHGIIRPANHAQISMRWLGFTPFEPKCGLIGPVCSIKKSHMHS